MAKRGIESIVTGQGHPTWNCEKKTLTNSNKKRIKLFEALLKFPPSFWGKKFLTNSAKNLFRRPELSKEKLIFANSESAKMWRTDILRNRSVGCPWLVAAEFHFHPLLYSRLNDTELARKKKSLWYFSHREIFICSYLFIENINVNSV